MKLQGKAGVGAFQWNRGGWFGAQLGTTLWLVILGVLLLAQARPPGALLVLFGDPDGRREFYAWSYAAIDGALFGLQTAGGVGIGSSVDELVSAYPGAEFVEEEPGLHSAFARTVDGIFWLDGDQVRVMSGGLACGE